MNIFGRIEHLRIFDLSITAKRKHMNNLQSSPFAWMSQPKPVMPPKTYIENTLENNRSHLFISVRYRSCGMRVTDYYAVPTTGTSLIDEWVLYAYGKETGKAEWWPSAPDEREEERFELQLITPALIQSIKY